jgi:two-component system sensor histidine kinase KdpD
VSLLGFLLAREAPSRRAGTIVGFTGVALCTLIIYPLKHVAPVVSLAVVYLPAVLVVSLTWGAWLGMGTAAVSAVAFDYFHVPPVGEFTAHHSSYWVVPLIAFIVLAALSSSLADLTRARARDAEARRVEADLAAEMARLLLRGAPWPRICRRPRRAWRRRWN